MQLCIEKKKNASHQNLSTDYRFLWVLWTRQKGCVQRTNIWEGWTSWACEVHGWDIQHELSYWSHFLLSQMRKQVWVTAHCGTVSVWRGQRTFGWGLMKRKTWGMAVLCDVGEVSAHWKLSIHWSKSVLPEVGGVDKPRTKDDRHYFIGGLYLSPSFNFLIHYKWLWAKN